MPGGIDYSSLVQKHMGSFYSRTNVTTTSSGYSAPSTANQIADALLGVGSMVAMMAIASKAQAGNAATNAQASDNANFASVTAGADTALQSYTNALATFESENQALQDLETRLANCENLSKLQEDQTKLNNMENYTASGQTSNKDMLQKYDEAKAKVDNLTKLQTVFDEVNPQIEAQDQIINAPKPNLKTNAGIELNSTTGGNVGSVQNYYSNNPSSAWTETKPEIKKGFVVRQQEVGEGENKKTQYRLEVDEAQRQADVNAAQQMDQYVSDVAKAKQTKTQLETKLNNAKTTANFTGELTPATLQNALTSAQTDLANADKVLMKNDGDQQYTASQYREEQAKMKSQINQASTDKPEDLKKQITAQKTKVNSAKSACTAAKTVLLQQRTSLQAMLTSMKGVATASQQMNTANTALQNAHDFGTDGNKRTGWQKFWNAGNKDKATIKTDKKLAKQAKQNYASEQANFTSANNFAFSQARYQAINVKIQQINTELAKFTTT